MTVKKDHRAAFEKVDQEDWWSVLSWLEAVKQEAATKEIVLLLCQLVGHKSPHVRMATMRILLMWVEFSAVQEVGEQVAESLAARFLYREHTDIKALAAGILSFLPRDGAFPLVRLHEQAEQGHEIDRARIERFFQELPARFLPAVLRLLAFFSPERSGNGLLYYAIWSMGEDAKAAIPLLLERIQTEPPREPYTGRRYLVQLIGQICGSDVGPLCDLLALNRSDINDACVRELKNKGKAAIPALPYVLRLIERREGKQDTLLPGIVEFFLALGEKAEEAVLPLFRRLKEGVERGETDFDMAGAREKAFLFFARVGSQKAKEILWESLNASEFRSDALKALPEIPLSVSSEGEEWAVRLSSLLDQGGVEDWEIALVAKALEAWGERAVVALPALLRVIGTVSEGSVSVCLQAVRAMGKDASKQAVERVQKLLGLQKNNTKDLLDFLAYALGEEGTAAVSDRASGESIAKSEWNEDIGQESTEQEGTESESEEDKEIILPFQSHQVRFEVRSMTVDLLLSRIKHNELVVQPEFQRNDVWSNVQKSRLIESLLLRIPLPSFYIDGSDADRWQVIDGQQRLTAIRAFLLDETEGSLRLEGLEFFSVYEGFHREQIPRHLLRRLFETQVTLFVVEAKMERALMFNIFKRINTGGTPLSSQEIRHALYQGRATELLRDLATSASFQKVVDGGVNDKRMEARELVLRGMLFFVRVPEKWFVFREEDRLNQAMEEVNRLSDGEANHLRLAMLRSYETAYALFGRYAFRKPPYDGKKSRSPLNKALFEAWVANLALLEPLNADRLVGKKNEVDRGWQELLREERFSMAISSATNQMDRAKFRFYAVERLLEKTLSLDEG